MKSILIVIDMQNDFIDGALGTKEAVAIVDKVKSKIEQYNSYGGTIIFTRDTHDENYLLSQEGKNLPVKHCVKESDGWQISKKLSFDGCKIIDKPSFGSIELASYIKMLNPESIELVGLCTDICVISNAMILKAVLPEVTISVDPACCAGVTPESHETALNAMKMCQITIL